MASVVSTPTSGNPPQRRRKYRYRSRQEAEEAQATAERKRLDQLRLARALYANRVQWGIHRPPYRFGIFDQHTPNGPRIVKLFAPGGQDPDLEVLDPYDELTALERYAARYANTDPECQTLLGCLRGIRSMLATLD